MREGHIHVRDSHFAEPAYNAALSGAGQRPLGGHLLGRIGCPFCESADDHRLSALAIEGERYLRIDYCQFCRAYLKTYNGEGSESLFLADWTSLHLDIIARDRGLKRLASSLYEL